MAAFTGIRVFATIEAITMSGPNPAPEDARRGLANVLHADTPSVSVHTEGGFTTSRIAYLLRECIPDDGTAVVYGVRPGRAATDTELQIFRRQLVSSVESLVPPRRKFRIILEPEEEQ